MRISKVVNIEGVGEVTIKEVRPFDIYKAMSADNKVEEIKMLALGCISLSEAKMKQLYTSEIEQLIDGFLEVNKSFLAIAEKLGLKQALLSTVTEILKTLPPLFADSYKQVMGKLSGSMDGAIL